LKSLSIAFGGLRAVDDVSFQVRPGEIVSVIGPNGAGKTTLFNMISGTLQANTRLDHAGRGRCDRCPNHICWRGWAWHGHFRIFRSFPAMTLLENVMVGHHLQEAGQRCQTFSACHHRGARRKKQLKARCRFLARVGLEKGSISEKALTMSYGALKRLEIARALALRPKILLLDEPAAGCNAVETEEIDQLISEIASSGVAILLVEHDMKLVMKISSHIIALDHGLQDRRGQSQLMSLRTLM
jgi:branched-chain amino acid transport system ATP-binding protein